MTRIDVSNTTIETQSTNRIPLTRILDRLAPLDLPPEGALRRVPALQVALEPQHKDDQQLLYLDRLLFGFLQKPGQARAEGDRKVRFGSLHRTRAGSGYAYLDGEDEDGLHHRLPPLASGPGTHPRDRLQEVHPVQAPRDVAPRYPSSGCEEAAIRHRPYPRPRAHFFLRTGMRIGEVLSLTMNDID
jgi:hypothetical protein